MFGDDNEFSAIWRIDYLNMHQIPRKTHIPWKKMKNFLVRGTTPSPDHSHPSPNPTTLSAYGAFGARPSQQFYDLHPHTLTHFSIRAWSLTSNFKSIGSGVREFGQSQNCHFTWSCCVALTTAMYALPCDTVIHINRKSFSTDAELLAALPLAPR